MILDTIQLGDPVEYRGVVVAPLFPRRRPAAEYVPADVAIPLGFRVTEVDAGGSVPELLADNPLDASVLLYDGEELLGAKQNRILNVTVLVGARSQARIPVSCVEEGRWSARSASFDAAPHAAYPELRRLKAERLAADPLGRGVAQGAVWESVREKAGRHGVSSPTHAQADVYRSRGGALGAIRDAFPLVPGQCGALFALGDTVTLDWVSRPDAWTRLYPRLLQGYALDALEQLDGKAAQRETLDAFVGSLDVAPRTHRPSAALGDDLRLSADGVVGSALELDGELVQLSAYSTQGGAALTRIARPSRRR